MPTDRARNSYDAGRQYRSVVAQQGRVSVEADANEAEEIRAAESRAELIDIIGPTGTPDHGFRIAFPAGGTPYDFTIGRGTIYVGGLRVHLDAVETYDGQKAREWVDRIVPDPDARKVPGTEIVYLELAEQEISAVEDPALLEVALGGPDTAGRTRLVRHVRRGPITAGVECEPGLLELLAKRTPGLVHDRATMALQSKAKLKVSTVPVLDGANVCQPIAKSGFLGAENQLIRIQVATSGELLWGYDNASFLYRVKPLAAAGKVLELVGHPVDEFHRPRQDQWVEVLHTAVDLGDGAYVATAVGEPYEVANYHASTNTLTLGTTLTNITGPLFVRVWESRVPFGGGPQDLIDSLGAGIGLRVEATGPATAGDFWMVGVRPTQPDKLYPPRFATAQPPDGPHRWATPLATIAWTKDGTSAVVHDCRRPFKPLTEDDDLAFHNQHLHGWGVVCGMQVHCMELAYAAKHGYDPHEWITVNNGYAIDPTGADIRLTSRTRDHLTPVNIADLADLEGGLKRVGGKVPDGSVTLWIDRHLRLRAEPYTQKPGKYDWQRLWQDLLAAPPGESMLADIYHDCILKVIDHIRALVPESSKPEVTFAQRLNAVVRGVEVPLPTQGLVGASARRLSALLDLIVQIWYPAAGRHVYLSGDAADPQSLFTEDGLLRTFFDDLKQLLQSKTFCAMFDDVEYPAYDVYRAGVTGAKPTTIFGTNRHTRIRVHPRLDLAFTMGHGSQINVYNLTTRRILRTVDFPSSGSEVQDVSFPNTGNEIYAIAWTGSTLTESMFAGGVIDPVSGEITWSGRTATAQLKLITLVSDPVGTDVYIAARGAGVYRFDPCVTATPGLVAGGLIRLGDAFSASGHLVGGAINVEQHGKVCIDARAHAAGNLPRPWQQGGFSVESMDARRELVVLGGATDKRIRFPEQGIRFLLPHQVGDVNAVVRVRGTKLTMIARDSGQNELGRVTSTDDRAATQTLTLASASNAIAFVDFIDGSNEGEVFELCIRGQANGWRLFAGEDRARASSDAFDRVREIDPADPFNPLDHALPALGGAEHGHGRDDLAFAKGDLQAIVDGPGVGTKRLLVWRHARGIPQSTDLGASAGSRIAYASAGDWNMITYIDRFLGLAYHEPGGLAANEFHPLQIMPASIAAGRHGDWFYVLESMSNTITAVPAASRQTTIDVTKLEAYRVKALTAFLKMFRRFAQFLKDCVCEHLLVNCPDPKGKHVYLADVSFKFGSVYQICNFHHRRYVHTFPTVEYWLSIIPIVPTLKAQVERFCCELKLGDYFDKYVPPADKSKAKSDSMIPVTAAVYGATHLRDAGIGTAYQNQTMQMLKVAQFVREKLATPSPGNPSVPTAVIEYANVPLATAKARAKDDNLHIANVVESNNVLDSALRIARGAPAIKRGEAVDLITDNGVVIGMARSSAPAPAAPADELAQMREEMARMRSEIEELKKR